MTFDKVIMNPPFDKGNRIWNLCREHIHNPENLICLMPINYYRTQNSFQYIKIADFVDETIFEDADITSNLVITKAQKEQNNTSWEDWIKKSWNKNFILFYNWNIKHFKNLTFDYKRLDTKKTLSFNINDFYAHPRNGTEKHGGFRGVNGSDYKYNYSKNPADFTLTRVAILHFDSEKACNNYRRYWYFWLEKKEKPGKIVTLNALTLYGLNFSSLSSTSYPAIPQINWGAISDHPLWDKDPDSAVLDTMGLKWNENKDGVIEK